MASDKQVFFDQISVGQKFKTLAEIVYQKISVTDARTISVKGKDIAENSARSTAAFYKSKIPLIISD